MRAPRLTTPPFGKRGEQLIHATLHRSEIHPDAWKPAIIRDPAETEAQMLEVAGAKYSYHDLDNYTDLLQRTLQGVPETSKVSRSGVLPGANLPRLFAAAAGTVRLRSVEAEGCAGSAEHHAAGRVAGGWAEGPRHQSFGTVSRCAGHRQRDYRASRRRTARCICATWWTFRAAYQSPPTYLNFLTWRDKDGKWKRSRAVTLAIYMRDGQQIDQFGKHVTEKLNAVKQYLPDDLIMVHTSDQPVQVKEQIDLFMDALYEAIGLVVIVSLIGFWEWRSALLMALSIPVTLSLTFGMIYLLGIDIQQVSVASLIIALGLLVDDPVVAGDSIKRMLAEGQPRIVAPWLGPTKIATAILYATITNIVAYLPFLLVTGNTGEFLFSLPIVMTCALVASRLASMTFIPLLAYYILRPDKKPEAPIEERRDERIYRTICAGGEVRHRAPMEGGDCLAGVSLCWREYLFRQLKSSFFPDDVQYWSYADVWLPNDANFEATNQSAQQVEQIIRQQAE